jgi:hypothetical protein
VNFLGSGACSVGREDLAKLGTLPDSEEELKGDEVLDASAHYSLLRVLE